MLGTDADRSDSELVLSSVKQNRPAELFRRTGMKKTMAISMVMALGMAVDFTSAASTICSGSDGIRFSSSSSL